MALTKSRVGCSALKAILLRQSACDGLPRIIAGAIKIQVATLKATHGEKYPYSEPYPYWKKRYNLWAAYFDRTVKRLNENSKVIVVEGNVGVGKKEFAQRLAREFDMKYFGPTPDSRCFTSNDYGFDVRGLDHLLPEGAKSYDLKKFLADKHPEKGTVGRLLLAWYEMRFYDYTDAMKHLLNTGQGVVMVRSAYSDTVFVEALRRMGYVTAPFIKYFTEYRGDTICELLKPHMTIYLDAPVSVCRERINKKKDPREIGSKVLSDKYLQTIADVYRDKYLPLMRKSGEVVEIDWTEIGTDMDMDVIAEELQSYKLEPDDNEDVKYEDWTRMVDDDWIYLRTFMEDRSSHKALFIRSVPWDCPEVYFNQSDAEVYNRVILKHPVWQYQPGWTPALGDKTLLKLG